MRPLPDNKALTLLELIIALILTAVIAVSVLSIDLFGRYHLITADKQMRTQREVSSALEHIGKNIISAIGNQLNSTAASRPLAVNSTTIEVYVDEASDGGIGDGLQGTGGDHWIAYRYLNGTALVGQRYRMEYCANYNNASDSCNTAWEVIAKNISDFSPSLEAGKNFVTVNITGCWDPSEPDPDKPCGTADNPRANMKTSLSSPSVSQN